LKEAAMQIDLISRSKLVSSPQVVGWRNILAQNFWEIKRLGSLLESEFSISGIFEEVKHMSPGPRRNHAIDNFWKWVHNGFYVAELDSLRARGRAWSEYIGGLDEWNEKYEAEERRSSVDSGGGVLAPE
jgi:hypothetical protein